MIKINVAEIKKRLVGTKSFSYELTQEELGIDEDYFKSVKPIVAKGELSNAGDVILLKANVSTEIERVCGRCLKDFVQPIVADVVEKFYPAGAEQIENDAFVYESDIVDIAESIRESLLLAVPLQSVCKSSCQGLCPICGADRNESDCGCDTTSVDPRLAALKQFIKH